MAGLNPTRCRVQRSQQTSCASRQIGWARSSRLGATISDARRRPAAEATRGMTGWMWRRQFFFRSPRETQRPKEDLQTRLQRVEAVLFIAKEPLASRRLAELADLDDGNEARGLVRRLNRVYDQHGHAFHVENVAGGFQLLTRPAFANWLRKLDHLPPELRLSGPAFETLAVVAYRQPVIRAEIEAIRGVNCGEMLKQLMDRDLIRISGRSDDLGRPFLYSTTKHFLKCFGLNHMDELPRADRMRRAEPLRVAASPMTLSESPVAEAESPESDEIEADLSTETHASDSSPLPDSLPGDEED